MQPRVLTRQIYLELLVERGPASRAGGCAAESVSAWRLPGRTWVLLHDRTGITVDGASPDVRVSRRILNSASHNGLREVRATVSQTLRARRATWDASSLLLLPPHVERCMVSLEALLHLVQLLRRT